VYCEITPRPTPRSTAIQPPASSAAITRTTVRAERRLICAIRAIEGKQLLPLSSQWFARQTRM